MGNRNLLTQFRNDNFAGNLKEPKLLAARFAQLLVLLTLLFGTPLLSISSEPLEKAVDRNDLKKARELLESGADPNVADKWGWTLLHEAVFNNNEAMVVLLLDHGANIEAKAVTEKWSYTSLDGSKSGTNIIESEMTPLLLAAKRNQFSVVKLLADKGAKINIKNAQGRSGLHFAARANNISLVRFLVEKGRVPIDVRSKYGVTPLIEAGFKADEKLARYLLDNGADVNAKSKEGTTALFGATEQGDASLIELLIERGANVNATNKDGVTPIGWALSNDDLSTAELLETHGAHKPELNTKLDVYRFQYLLASLAYKPGPIDGVVGLKTIAAIRTFQADNDLDTTGRPSHDLLLMAENTISGKNPKWNVSKNRKIFAYINAIKLRSFSPRQNISWASYIEASDALEKLGENAVPSLIAMISSKHEKRERAIDILGKIKSPKAVPVLILSLDDQWLEVRRAAVYALDSIGDGRAVLPLVETLKDWWIGPNTGPVLERFGWKPKSDAEHIHYSLAVRDGSYLKQNYDRVEKVLLNDVESEKYRIIENAVFAFIGLGIKESISKLIEKLNQKGNKIMAEAYLNSRHSILYEEAEKWAVNHGYRVKIGPGAAPVKWGSF